MDWIHLAQGRGESGGCSELRNERSCLAEEPSFSLRGLHQGVNIGSIALIACKDWLASQEGRCSME
jgi:hypothetical protein